MPWIALEIDGPVFITYHKNKQLHMRTIFKEMHTQAALQAHQSLQHYPGNLKYSHFEKFAYCFKT